MKKTDIEPTKQYIDDEKQYIDDKKQYIEKLIDAGLTKKTAENAMKLFAEFGVRSFFSRADTINILRITATPASTLLKKLYEKGVTEAVSGLGKGKYRFSPAFFYK